jgi:hypothetical protein
MVYSYDFVDEHDEQLTMTPSDFLDVFYADATLQSLKRWALRIFNAYFIWTAVSAIHATVWNATPYEGSSSVGKTSYVGKTSSVGKTLFFDQAFTPNLTFCETPFAITPYMAQGASAMAHLPYVPVLLLAIGSTSPGTIPTLDNHQGHKIKHMLWLQTGLQVVTSVGHMLPNPRIIFIQELSISMSLLLLNSFFVLTTPKMARRIVDFNAFATMAAMSILGYLWFGLLPVIFTLFAASLALSYTIREAFGLLTPYSRATLLAIFVATASTLAVEAVACDWLLANVSYLLPWHLLFDILFWQVLGSAIDVIVITPVPGRFMIDDI